MTQNEDRGPLDLTRLIEEKDAEIKKLCAEIGSLEFQITDYKQIVQELSERLKNYESLHGTVLYKNDKKSK
tara:strand:+ start:820 stop:1032 length:213 start_codon:yes stop_codon:yes gene_type:complete